MEKLFKDLPRDLQWEILTEFVGSHSVRKGKLIQKIVFDYRHRMLLVHASLHSPIKSTGKPNLCRIVSCAQLRDNSILAYCHDKVGSGKMGYMFLLLKENNYYLDYVYTPMNDSVILPTFVKHYYTSYEDTDKKKIARHPSLRRVPYAYASCLCAHECLC